MRLVLVGTSHHYAPVELRERVALDKEQAAALAAQLGEAVVLSTCNRTEIYVAADDGDAAEREAVAALVDLAPALYKLRDHAAALHLFRVAAGLDSLVPGEGEILGQVRTAYEHGQPGLLLDRLLHDALHAGKRARAQTTIAESPASVSSAAAALAQQVFGDLKGKRVLIVGAGKVGELAARSLSMRGAELVAVVNRSEERGDELARTYGAAAVPTDALAEELANADVAVSCTSAPGFMVQ